MDWLTDLTELATHQLPGGLPTNLAHCTFHHRPFAVLSTIRAPRAITENPAIQLDTSINLINSIINPSPAHLTILVFIVKNIAHSLFN